jgi:uncharacterized protein (TIGR03643 family)
LALGLTGIIKSFSLGRGIVKFLRRGFKQGQAFNFADVMQTLTVAEADRVIEMAWEDRTPFEAIAFQFGLTEADVIQLMRQSLKPSSFRLWRSRVNSGVSHKHLKKRSSDIDRFRCSRQRIISGNKISKR